MEIVQTEVKDKKYYLAQINHLHDSTYRKKLEAWSWDIYIAKNGQNQMVGRATAPGKGVEVPWTELVQSDHLEEMISICEKTMPKHS